MVDYVYSNNRRASMATSIDRELPTCLHFKHGAYYYVRNHVWVSFGRDRVKAVQRAIALNEMHALERRALLGRVRAANESLKGRVFARDKYKCVYCGATDDLVIDHVIPFVRGGSTDMRNIVTACAACNQSKNDRDPMEFLCGMQDAAGKIVDSVLYPIGRIASGFTR